MASPLALTWRVAALLPLAACGGDADRPPPPATAEDRQLTATGLQPDAVAAARAYLPPFTRADQNTCFKPVAATSVALERPVGEAFAVAPGVTRVVIAVDGSGSMAAALGGRTKLALAKEATLAFVDTLDPSVEASLLVFGQQGDNSERGKALSCRGIDQAMPPSRDRGALRQSVGAVRAVGWTPLAAALARAQAQLAAASPGRQVIYVVSDGAETCGGDPVATARAINTGDTHAIVNIIGFDLPPADRAALDAVARAGGGALIDIADDSGFRRVMVAMREAKRRQDNRVLASNAGNYNVIDTGAAINAATICTGEIITREVNAVGDDLTARAGQSTLDRGTVFAVLEQRHQRMRVARDAYAARLTGSRDQAIDAIEAQEKSSR